MKKTYVNLLKDRLIKLFKRTEPFVISLSGEWGVGKTRFWNNFKDEYLKDKKVSYVSLFGKDSIESIRTDIIFQISKKDEYISKSKGFFKDLKSSFGLKEDINFGLTGSVLSSLLTLFSKKDFEDVVICFDDFERLSNSLNEKDILGLISELKEQKNCQIVMILNEGKVQESALSEYKDKIIDYEFHYSPTPEESYSLVKSKLICFHDYPLKYFERMNINNIRVMKRVIDSLNDFSFVQELVSEFNDIEREIVENIIELSTINSITTFKDFNKLSDYTLSKMNDDFKINKKYEEVLSYIDLGDNPYFYITDITSYMMDYFTNYIVNENILIEMINERKSIENRSEVFDKIRDLYNKFSFELNYMNKDFVKELFLLFKNNKTNIVGIVSTGNFIFYINLLKELDNEKKSEYHDFAVQVLKVYLDENIKNDKKISGFERDNYEQVRKFDKYLEEYEIKQTKEKEENKISDITKVIELMKYPVENRSWGDEPILLALLDEEKIKSYILQSSEFVEVSFDLIRYIGKYTTSDFKVYFDKLFNVFEEIKNSKNIDYTIKMTKLLRLLNKN